MALGLTAIALLLTAVPESASACFMRSPQPVQVSMDHISVDVVNNVAVKTYHCTFRNPNGGAIVGGTCYMELEPGSQVDNMSVLVDGRETQAEILDVDQARKVFEDIVKSGGSAALLEYFGNQLIQTKVPRVPAGKSVTVRLQYTTVLKERDGLVRLQMLNTNPKTLMQPLDSASVTVNFRSDRPLKNIYSPSHEIKFVEREGWDVSIEWKEENYLPKHPFVLYRQVGGEAVGASLVAHRELDEDGTFMLLLSPTLGNGAGQITDSQILPKDVVFCIDTSGSMLQGGKMDQARAALEYCVKTLRPGDRFNIVDFSTAARSLSDTGLLTLDETSRAKAQKYVAQLRPLGGTAINDALLLALKQLRAEDSRPEAGSSETEARRLKMIVFATDGLPTIGERDPEAILRNVAKQNTDDVRIFVFGEGFDVNTKLLDFLAFSNRGDTDYILPDEDITKKISRFFDRVGSPIMTDVQITFDGLETRDVFPARVSDMYRGEQIIVYGRYTGHGRKTVNISGNVAGSRRTFSYELDFPEYSEDDKASFVPRLWAGSKVDFLLSELRTSGMEDKELVEEVTRLAKRYGIVTPYTSFLMTDDVVTESNDALAARFGRRASALARTAAPGAPAQAQVEQAKQENEFRRKNQKSGGVAALDEAAEAFSDRDLKAGEGLASGKKLSSLEQIRSIGTRTYYQRGTDWYDSRFELAKMPEVQEVVVGSEEYIELLRKHPRFAKHLALVNAYVEIEGQWYRFRERS
ncbi:MAG: VWA domain-containing protein [Planctomycetaceae bacterium]|nr:VWA domain-containing protein [Planctomycetaceae bacterium]